MTEKKKPGRVGILSAVIDPLLFEGGRRVFQIANKVVEHFGNKYDKKQIVNNIRSRITFLTTRKGYRFEKNSLKQVQLVVFTDKELSTINEPVQPVNVEHPAIHPEVPVTETK